MALYYYQAFSKEGKKIKGQIDASSLQNAKDSISRSGFFVISIELLTDPSKGMPWYKKLFQKKVDIKEKILFTKQLSVLLKSGIPLLQALELLINQFEGELKSIIISIKDGVKEGRSLAEGLSRYPKIFDNIYVQLVRAGEATGKLEIILDRLVTFLERKLELQKKVSGALRMPLIQLGFALLVVGFMMTFVVPKLMGTFQSQGADLPMATKILLAMSDFIKNHYIILIILFLSLIAFFTYLKLKPWGRLLIDKIKLRLPIIKYFTKMGAVVQFCKTLGMLLESGVNLSEALDIVCKIIDNKILATALTKAKDKIIKEGKITQYLSETKLFPPIAIYLLKTGEQSGELAQMLLLVADNYEADLAEYSDGLAENIAPVMLVFMAGTVGFIVMAIALPIMKMSTLVGL